MAAMRSEAVRDGERVLDAERGFQNRHQPDRTSDAALLARWSAIAAIHFSDLLGSFDLRNQNEVGRLRNDLFQIGAVRAAS